jgi:hypothetical protein
MFTELVRMIKTLLTYWEEVVELPSPM